jgi:hypothetical protein
MVSQLNFQKLFYLILSNFFHYLSNGEKMPKANFELNYERKLTKIGHKKDKLPKKEKPL